MSKLKTYPITKYEFDDLVTALDIDREAVAKICNGLTKDAIGWWRFKERIPFIHLESLKDALEKKLKGRKDLNPVEQRAIAFVKTALASDSAVPLSSKSPFYSSFTGKLAIENQSKNLANKFDLSRAPLEELIKELGRRGGIVTFGAKK